MNKDMNIKRMKELTELLNKASKAYYQDASEIMSNFEYDKLYDELVELERKTGVTLSGSPTKKVGYEILSELPKEAHESRMLSLDKTKMVEELESWLGEHDGVLSWKLDGLTIVLTYENGILTKAVTRGNGEVGEVITNNAKVFSNVPLEIPYKGKLVLRGEAVITYSEFRRINESLSEVESKYKNPRNLCSGSVRQLNNKITAQRNVHFFAFSLVSSEKETELEFHNSREQQLLWLREQGFDVVERRLVSKENLADTIKWFSEKITTNDFPSDGLVLILDDIAYGKSLGTTSKYPRDAIAFKWKDEIAETKLLEIEWSASRTGLINPVAIFEPVELEGTTVSRASIHNISIVEGLQLGIGDTITVYKANMIIPQIAENLTKSGNIEYPKVCPVCNCKTSIKKENDVKVLVCTNQECLAKQIKSFTHFISRDAMNVEGISEATIEKMVDIGILRNLADLFRIGEHKEKIVSMEGFGERSYEKMIMAIEKSRNVSMPQFLYSLGIANVGLSNAKLICKAFQNDFDAIMDADMESLEKIDKIGPVIAQAFYEFMNDEKKRKIIEELRNEVEFSVDTEEVESVMDGIQFVITGSVEHFTNRKELKEYIEQRGGKVTGTVTSKTDYLINNDNMSGSSKNKKAKELGIPILTEVEFLEKWKS